MIHLLDTNAVSKILRRDWQAVRSRFEDLLKSGGTIQLPIIVMHEMHYGALRSAKPQSNLERIGSFTSRLRGVVDLTAKDAEIAAEVRAELSAKGQTIGSYDLLIAAQALRLEATLVTSNVREFSRVPGLKWEDWAAA